MYIARERIRQRSDVSERADELLFVENPADGPSHRSMDRRHFHAVKLRHCDGLELLPS
jgi:hypothetical protein